MQAIEDWECHDTTVCLGRSRHRLFLPQALMWPSLVVEANVVRDETQKMALAKHEDMVEQFTPESADKALGEGVHVRGPDRGANDFGADGFKQAREPSLASRSTTSTSGWMSSVVLRACCAHQSSDGARVTAACMILRLVRSRKNRR